MSKLHFTGGGSLDGAELELPAHVTGVVTIERDGGCSHYVLDDLGAAYHFTGLNEIGAIMAGFMRELTAAARAEREAVEAAMRPVGCRYGCGATFGSPGAYAVHFERGEGSRCLPGDARGQLVEVDGIWCLPGTDVARR